MKHLTTRYIIILAITYVLLGPLLLYVESRIFGSVALHQALPITVIAVIYFAYSKVVMSLIERGGRSGRQPLGLFLLDNVVRFFMTCIILVVYGFVNRDGIVHFGINLLVYYLATLIIVTCFTVRMSR